METDASAQFIKMAPEKLGAYISVICMDDATITRSKIKEDLGSESRGSLTSSEKDRIQLVLESRKKRSKTVC